MAKQNKMRITLMNFRKKSIYKKFRRLIKNNYHSNISIKYNIINKDSKKNCKIKKIN